MSFNRNFIPGTFTMGNVVCGFLSILSAFDNQITTACWFIILAGFLDVLDGKVARLSGSTSQFGVELDSLADFLSFGVAPAVLVHAVGLDILGKWVWFIPVIFIMAASYRLARYNLLADTEEKKDFMGLPVPAAGFALVSYILFSYYLWGKLQYSEILTGLIILSSFLMVSQVSYEALPDRFESKHGKIKLAAIIISIVLILINTRLLLFPFVSLYILFGIVRELYRLFNRGIKRVASRQHKLNDTDKGLNNEQE